MVRWLGSWIGTETIDPSLDDERAAAHRGRRGDDAYLARHGSGLAALPRAHQRWPGRSDDGGGVWREGEAPADTAWVRMKVESTGWMPENDFISLVRDEVPAHVHAELYVGDRRVWPAAGEGEPG